MTNLFHVSNHIEEEEKNHIARTIVFIQFKLRGTKAADVSLLSIVD